MNNPADKQPLDSNLQRMLSASLPPATPDFEGRLTDTVLTEVARQRKRAHTILRLRRPLIALAAAAAIILALGVWWPTAAPRPAGRLVPGYGIVTLANGAPPVEVTQPIELAPGQIISTAWGSRAEIALHDGSSLVLGPRTTLSINDTPGGFRLSLDHGALYVKAAKQTSPKSLRIDTPGAEIKVLGTVFDVLVSPADGAAQTLVSVVSGSVQLTSGGQRALLKPDMSALAGPGKPPVVVSKVPEIREIARLIEMSKSLASKDGLPRQYPSILEFKDAGVIDAWLVVDLANATAVTSCTLTAATPFTAVSAFTIEGLPLKVRARGALFDIDLSEIPLPAGATRTVVLHMEGVSGLCRKETNAVFSFDMPADPDAPRALVEMRLPEDAWVSLDAARVVDERTASGARVFLIDARLKSLGLLVAR